MKFYSTNQQSPAVSFRDATIQGQAPDNGLYFPQRIPQLDRDWINELPELSNEEIALKVIAPYVGDSIPIPALTRIVAETVNFSIPLVKVTDNISSLELFHGPTLAFKDVGARFMSRCLGYFLKDQEKKVTVLVATSGDTGGAVANGFLDVDGVEVIILYPSGKVSPVQEKQLTALGRNIHALEVNGSFDDCQHTVKQAFADEALRSKFFLTSANSINVARWLPQQFYYFFACKQWPATAPPPVVSVPSGNFGNICAGLLARQSGLPVRHFIAACNANDAVTRYLGGAAAPSDGFQPQSAVPTLSNAMDVGNPSNFVRILELFQRQFPSLKDSLSSYSVSDDETIAAIHDVYRQYGYVMDPHGAVGWLALNRYLSAHPGAGIFLETAHPVKFPDAVQRATGVPVDIPRNIIDLMNAPKQSTKIDAGYDHLREFLNSKA